MLYVVYVDINDKGYVGIKKKILAQIRVFEKEFGRVLYTTCSGQMIYLMSYGKVLDKKLAITKKDMNETLIQWIEEYKIRRTYIRYDYSDQWFIGFLKYLKERNVRSVLEFPSIPYDGELSNKRLIFEDGLYRQQLKEYLTCCTTYTKNAEVFGIPCISLVNGIDIQEHPMQVKHRNDNSIRLLGVASMAKWHGYERVIEGMHNYYCSGGKLDVQFDLVGDGPDTGYYKNMVYSFHLEDKVHFCGVLDGKDLDIKYAEADISFGPLGAYKKNVLSGASIKLREYCARGIPFVYGYYDESFDENTVFALRVPNQPGAIEIEQVIDFYYSLPDTIHEDMHIFAQKNLTWSTILAGVVTFYLQ